MCVPLTICIHVNSILIRDESDSQGGTLTDRVEELLGGGIGIWGAWHLPDVYL